MPWSDFEKLEFLGKGSYGVVTSVRRKSDGKIYALKEVDMSTMSHREREDAVNEIRLLASVSHPNIIGYYESFLEGHKLCIVTEFCPNGDLFALLRKYAMKRRRLSEERIWAYFIQICHALNVMHKQSILHRDVKSANVFVGDDGRIKLGDLGVAKLMKANAAKTQIGTPYYLSPEIWRAESYDDKSDVWSLGCLLYEMTTLRLPFEGSTNKMLRDAVLRGRYPAIPRTYSPDLKAVIAACLSLSPRGRPTVEQLLAMPAVASRASLAGEHAPHAPASGEVMHTIKVPKRKLVERDFNDLTEALPKPKYMRSSPAKMLRCEPEPHQVQRQHRVFAAAAAPPVDLRGRAVAAPAGGYGAAPALAAVPPMPPVLPVRAASEPHGPPPPLRAVHNHDEYLRLPAVAAPKALPAPARKGWPHAREPAGKENDGPFGPAVVPAAPPAPQYQRYAPYAIGAVLPVIPESAAYGRGLDRPAVPPRRHFIR